jgi:hypothetical protein
MRRFTRLSNAFSKKVENHAHAVALHFMWYNFGRVHKTLRITPRWPLGCPITSGHWKKGPPWQTEAFSGPDAAARVLSQRRLPLLGRLRSGQKVADGKKPLSLVYITLDRPGSAQSGSRVIAKRGVQNYLGRPACFSTPLAVCRDLIRLSTGK